MAGLGFILTLVIVAAWLCPGAVGKWLAKVEAGYRSALNSQVPHD